MPTAAPWWATCEAALVLGNSSYTTWTVPPLRCCNVLAASQTAWLWPVHMWCSPAACEQAANFTCFDLVERQRGTHYPAFPLTSSSMFWDELLIHMTHTLPVTATACTVAQWHTFRLRTRHLEVAKPPQGGLMLTVGSAPGSHMLCCASPAEVWVPIAAGCPLSLGCTTGSAWDSAFSSACFWAGGCRQNRAHDVATVVAVLSSLAGHCCHLRGV